MGTKQSREEEEPISLFRSEDMICGEFYLPSEVAYPCLAELGELELVEFHDLNDDLSAKERPYYGEISLLSRAQGILDHIRTEITRNNLEIRDEDDELATPEPGDLLEIVETFENINAEMVREKSNIDELEEKYQQQVELRNILSIAKELLPEASKIKNDMDSDDKSAEDAEEGKGGGDAGIGDFKLNYIAGVIRREKFPPFERLIWRSCRGKAFVKFIHIDEPTEDPTSNVPIYKTGFLVFFQGEKLRQNILKVANGFRAVIYPIPKDPKEYEKALKDVNREIEDMKKVMDISEAHYKKLLDVCAHNLENWTTNVLKMKAIYNILNNFKTKPYVGEGWMAKRDLDTIRNTLKKTAKERGSETEPVVSVKEEPNEEPPTYFKKNKFTDGFQVLVDAYGIATYKELNPMPYAVISFPFLFALMFGDFGHGTLVFLLGFCLVLTEDKLLKQKSRNEIRNIIVGGRYVIMLMGVFSMYAGLIYNDCFAACFNIFGSSWRVGTTYATLSGNAFYKLDPKFDTIEYPYAFGLDPMWKLAANQIIFLNSFKMKISVIFGVLQMIFGLFLNLWNSCYFRQPINIIGEFLPMIIWMLCMFTYLTFLMFIKWIKYGPKKHYKQSPTCAPSVLIQFIDMILVKDDPHVGGCDRTMYDYQGIVQKILLLCAVACIPWLFIVKPICVILKNKKKQKKTKEKNPNPEESNTGEILIHQGIITIEYILGSISHTASYLRLWALSLAHSQLTEVLWTMVLGKVVTISSSYLYIGGIFIFVAWAIWCFLTLAILVLMEGLSAFLHTLRLHWVEFQSKFYSGLGYGFTPFSFNQILRNERT